FSADSDSERREVQVVPRGERPHAARDVALAVEPAVREVRVDLVARDVVDGAHADAQIELHRDGERVEAGPEVGDGGRDDDLASLEGASRLVRRQDPRCGGRAHSPLPFVRIGRSTGGCTWKSSAAISRIALPSVAGVQGSTVMTNGSASFVGAGCCSTASMLISCDAMMFASAAMMPGRSRTTNRT